MLHIPSKGKNKKLHDVVLFFNTQRNTNETYTEELPITEQ